MNPRRVDHDQFCRIEGWSRVRARGRDTPAHLVYELALRDGRVLRTRVIDPESHRKYGSRLAGHVLAEQLRVSESEFWACVSHGTVPDRGEPQPRASALPLELAHLLVHRAGIPESTVMRMDRQQAVTRLNQYWNA